MKLVGELEKLYSRIHLAGTDAILNEHENIDTMLNHLETDNRLGLTLLIRPSRAIAEMLEIVAAKVGEIEPNQYFYPATDLHVTYLDIISAKVDFKYDKRQITQIIQSIGEAINGFTLSTLEFKGLALSKGAILVKGYYNRELWQLHDTIYLNIKEKGIVVNERYPNQIPSAHMTMVRFKNRLQNREKLLELIETNQDLEIGSMNINELELVIHDWYNRKKTLIHKFVLNGSITQN